MTETPSPRQTQTKQELLRSVDECVRDVLKRTPSDDEVCRVIVLKSAIAQAFSAASAAKDEEIARLRKALEDAEDIADALRLQARMADGTVELRPYPMPCETRTVPEPSEPLLAPVPDVTRVTPEASDQQRARELLRGTLIEGATVIEQDIARAFAAVRAEQSASDTARREALERERDAAERRCGQAIQEREAAAARIATLESLRRAQEDALQQLEPERDRLREALREIAEHPHCSYDHPSNSSRGGDYGIGTADGHRCAANVARAALKGSNG